MRPEFIDNSQCTNILFVVICNIKHTSSCSHLKLDHILLDACRQQRKHFSLSATKIGTIGNDEKLKDLQPKLEKCIKSIEESGTQVTAAMTVDCDLFVHALIQVLEEEQSRLPF